MKAYGSKSHEDGLPNNVCEKMMMYVTSYRKDKANQRITYTNIWHDTEGDKVNHK